MKRASEGTALKAFILFAVLWLASCSGALAQTQLANPASQRCIQEGGTLQIEQRPDGGQFGVCVFTDNRQCEEWAMFRVECPVGGLRVTGYLTPAARYCAITGGRVSDEDCILPGGKTCDAAAYFAGTCTK
jgi:putative hemolysin